MDLHELWVDLNRPAAGKFAQELRKRGIKVKVQDIEELFSKYQSSKQLFRRGPRYLGHIVSTGPNDRWFVDIMTVHGQHYVVAQDVFTRKAYASWIEEISDAPTGMSNILDEGVRPREIVTDADPVFRGADFKRLLAGFDIEHTVKVGRQDLATVDSLISRVKRAAAEHEADTGVLDVPRAVEGANKSSLKILYGAAPDEVARNHQLIFQREWDEAEAIEHNSRLAASRASELARAGAFRTYIAPNQRAFGEKGFQRRADTPVWSHEVHVVDDIIGPWVISDGRRYLTKEVQPVHAESTELAPPRLHLKPKARDVLRRYATRAQSLVAHGRVTSVYFTRILNEVHGRRAFLAALREAGVSARTPAQSMVRVYPDLFRTVMSGNRSFIARVEPAPA